MPSVSRLMIHPIKSLDAQEVADAEVLPSGALAHDRAYAIVDVRGNFVNGKQHAAIHRLRTRLDIASGLLALCDTSDRGLADVALDIRSSRTVILEWLADFFGFKVTLEEDRETGFPDDRQSPGPTFIATATLAAIARWFDLPIDQVRPRFRTNIEIDDVPPFWEDRLFGRDGEIVPFSVGAVRFNGINPCQRCAVPTRDPWTGVADRTFAPRFSSHRRDSLPSWSTRERFGHFFRVAVNTRIEARQPGDRITVGDCVAIGQTRPAQPL